MIYRDGFEPGRLDAITDVPGVRVGHWTNRREATGCTVILCETAVAAAVDVRGGAPGTRETDVLASPNLVRTCHAVLFCGGSAFGLDAASGVMRYLAERGAGFETPNRNVPIVSAAVIYDLAVGRPTAFPGGDAGYRAANSATAGKVTQGTVGAGTGATAAKVLGPERMVKGGIGTASLTGPGGIVVGALVVSNPTGHVVDPLSGAILAGPRSDEPGAFVPLGEAIAQRWSTAAEPSPGENTTLICVATNATFAHHQLQRVAYQAQNGLARTVVPAHTIGDGDTAFAISMGSLDATPSDGLVVGTLATLAVERAMLSSIASATGIGGVPSAAEWRAHGRGP